MPVVFEQAAPMAPDIVAGGGRAEVATRDLPTIASLYEAANRNQLAASEATARNATQSGIAGAQIANQSSMEADRLGLQRYEFDRSREVSERDNFQANVQAHAAQQHVELQAWLQGQELSQAEQMQLQRDKNAIGWVQSNPDLDDDTKLAFMAKLKTRIDLGNERQQMAKAKLEQAQTEKILHANAQQTSMENMDAAARSAEFQKRTFTMTNPQTGEEQLFYTDHKGDAAPVPFDGGKHAAKEGPVVDENGLTLKEHNAERAAAVKAANAFIAASEKPPVPGAPAPPPATPEDRLAMQKRFMQEMYGRDLDWKPAKPQRPNPQSEGLPGAMSDQGQPQGANQGSGEGGPAQEPAPPKSMPESKPEDVQKTSDSMREKAKAATWLPEGKRKELVGLIDERAKILADYSGKITPPAVWQRLDQITAALKGVPKEPPPDPRKRPVPSAHRPDWLERNIVGPADRFLQGFPGAGAGTPGPGPA